MSTTRLHRSSHQAFRALGLRAPSFTTRNQSTEADLREKLTSRPPNVTYDYLSPTPSHLLDLSLDGFFNPAQSLIDSSEFGSARSRIRKSAELLRKTELPQGHHLVYFSPQISTHALLPDGTDILHSPGAPFVRRMWAGGSLNFRKDSECQLRLQGAKAACIEHISDVTVKGHGDAEKVFVKIERRMGYVIAEDGIADNAKAGDHGEEKRREGHSSIPRASLDSWAILEVRNLVFMREKTAASARSDSCRVEKIVKSKHNADYSISMIPNKNLLFRFSALTFNAHGIHLDPEYCRHVEGHRGLLVHGPLSLVLALSVLRTQLKEGRRIVSFDYRNLAPLYVDERLQVCVRRNPLAEEEYEVWIEGRGGGYAVKGTAIVDK